MAQPISLFSGYNQKENRTTNYSLLVLRLLYEENPKFLAEVLSGLVDETVGNLVGVRFLQQQRTKSSIPDGVLHQPSFMIYIETKNYDWFYDRQLEQHLAALESSDAGAKVLIALGNFEVVERSFERIRHLCATEYSGRIHFAQVSFEDFLHSVESLTLPKNLFDTIADFRQYLDGQNLLPTWKGLLDVVNCAGLPQEVLEGGVYLCPATGGAYQHRRARYLGMYR
jgi:hypothetical protein